jgi:hypothetical protein
MLPVQSGTVLVAVMLPILGRPTRLDIESVMRKPGRDGTQFFANLRPTSVARMLHKMHKILMLSSLFSNSNYLNC